MKINLENAQRALKQVGEEEIKLSPKNSKSAQRALKLLIAGLITITPLDSKSAQRALKQALVMHSNSHFNLFKKRPKGFET